VVLTILKNMKVNGKDYHPIYYGKKSLKPPARFIDVSPCFHPATVILQAVLRLQQQLLHIRHVALQRGRRRLRGANGGAVVGDLFAARGFEIGTCLPWAMGQGFFWFFPMVFWFSG